MTAVAKKWIDKAWAEAKDKQLRSEIESERK